MSGHTPAECTPESKWPSPAPKNVSPWSMKASRPSAKSATCSAPPIPRRSSRPAPSGANSGQTIMVNAAHASDSEENANRELAIVPRRREQLPHRRRAILRQGLTRKQVGADVRGSDFVPYGAGGCHFADFPLAPEERVGREPERGLGAPSVSGRNPARTHYPNRPDSGPPQPVVYPPHSKLQIWRSEFPQFPLRGFIRLYPTLRGWRAIFHPHKPAPG